MQFLSKIFKPSLKEPSQEQLQAFSNDKKMEYILGKIKSAHQSLMTQISQEFQDKVEYQQNVCYDQYRNDIDQFAECSLRIKDEADLRVQIYKKKVAFISLAASKCMFEQNRTVSECNNEAIELASSIMNSQLQYIKSWNPNI